MNKDKSLYVNKNKSLYEDKHSRTSTKGTGFKDKQKYNTSKIYTVYNISRRIIGWLSKLQTYNEFYKYRYKYTN